MKYIVILCLFMGSCTTYKKATRYLNNTEQGAMYCATTFPVRDTLFATGVSYIPVDNQSYRNEINSLNKDIWALQLTISDHKKLVRDTGACCEVARNYISVIDSLSNRIQQLKDKYKPCAPDTIKITQTILRRDTAAETVSNKRASDSVSQTSIWKKAFAALCIYAFLCILFILIKK